MIIPGVLAQQSLLAFGGSWTPAQLFQGGEKGAAYDPRILSTLWQDTAGTTPITTGGQSVARMDDISGNSHPMTQATAGSRPLYDAGGFITLDGVNDVLASAGLADVFSGVTAGTLFVAFTWSGAAAASAGYAIAVETSGGPVRAGIAQGEHSQSGATPRLLIIAARRQDADSVNAVFSTGFTYTQGTRHNLIGEYEWSAGQTRLYRESTLIASGATSSGPTSATNSAAVSIGRVNSANNFFGRIHGAVFINRLLTVGEKESLLAYFA